MHAWGYRVGVPVADTRPALDTAMGECGFVAASPAKAAFHTYVSDDGEGGTLLIGHGIGGMEIASALSENLERHGTWVEVDLFDDEVNASRCAVRESGELGPLEDLDEEATEYCEEWFEGGKYLTEALHGLIAVFLDLDDEPDRAERRGWSKSRESTPAIAAEERASREVALPPFRVFRHPDGRQWQIRVTGTRIDLRIAADGPDRVDRSRTYRNEEAARDEAQDLIGEQLRDGFVEQASS